MRNVLKQILGSKCTTNNEDGDEKRQAVEEGTEKTNGKLDQEIVGSPIAKYVIRKGREHGPPVTKNIEKNKE